uniref:Uncharacterized protein n=1 Tax=Escherichia coli TaxID=562 RepID=A0A6G9I2N3_ECOLX|nr:hypothetical protein [Escherichia coli]
MVVFASIGSPVGKTIHYPWRLHYHPLFMSPIEHKSHAVKAVSK